MLKLESLGRTSDAAMASIRDLYSNKDTAGLDSNFGVDYVINYKIPQEGAIGLAVSREATT